MVDQGAFSLSNFILTFTIFRIGTDQEFGIFAACYTLYLLAQTVGRATIGEILLVRLGEAAGREVGVDSLLVPQALGASIQLGLVFSTIAVPFGLLIDGLGPMTMAIVVALPVLLFQDTLRHVELGRQSPERAMRSDLAWLALQLLAFLTLSLVLNNNSAHWYVWAWVLAGGGSIALFGPPTAGLIGQLGGSVIRLSWVRRERSSVVHLFVDALLGRGGPMLGQLLAGAVISPAVLAPLRLARSAMGPVQAASSMAIAATAPRAAQLLAVSRSEAMAMMRRASYALALFGFLYTLAAAVALVLIDLGDSSTERATATLLVLAPGMALQGLALYGRVGLRVLGKTGSLAAVRLITGPTTIIAVCLGAVALGWLGVVLGSILGNLLGLVLLEVAIRRDDRAMPERLLVSSWIRG